MTLPDIPVRKLVLAMAVVFASAVAVYMNSHSNELVWDDEVFIGRNPFVNDCSNLKTALNPVYLAKVLPVLMSARPVVNASLIMDTCSGASAGRSRPSSPPVASVWCSPPEVRGGRLSAGPTRDAQSTTHQLVTAPGCLLRGAEIGCDLQEPYWTGKRGTTII